MKTIKYLASATLLMACSHFQAAALSAIEPTPLPSKEDFISKQSAKGFSIEQTNAFLNDAKKNDEIIKLITTPWEAKPWHQYHPIFINKHRLKAGLAFWHQHHQTLERAAKVYQVEPELIVAIIGIETSYGRYTGKYNVRDALYTLAFHYPERSPFFYEELSHLMVLSEQQNFDLKNLKGSYAGAMGYGQFIPSSYLNFAVDFDNDGDIDLLNNPTDAIGSVANYFNVHGWQYQQPVVTSAKLTKPLPTYANLFWQREAPLFSIEQWRSHGVETDYTNPSAQALLFELEHQDSSEYLLGLNNFYAITRYNRSPLYAMAVHLFSQELKHAYSAR